MDKIGALTTKTFCNRYGVSRSRLYELIRDKHITAAKNGSRTLIPVVEAERWLASLPRLGDTV